MKAIETFLTSWRSSDKPYVIHGDTVLTYHEANTAAAQGGQFLAETGIRGQNVALFATNSIEYILGYFSCVLAGNTNIPINVKLTDAEVAVELDYCDCNWMIVQAKYVERLLNIPDTRKIGIIEMREDGRCRLVRNAERSAVRANSSNVAVMLHTSGTTGSPKKVMLTHRNLWANTQSQIDSLGLTDRDTVLLALPLFFGYCHTSQFLTHTRLGGTLVIYDRPVFTARDFLSLVRRHGVTCFTGVPTMLEMINRYPFIDRYDSASLRYVCFGGGPMDLNTLTELMRKMPRVGFVQTYGQTECSPRVTALLPKDSLRKLGSVGKPIPGVEAQIVGDDGTATDVRNIGEIRVRGDNTCLGYYKNAEETGKILRDGWLYTGDLAKRDEEGFIFLVGRRKNVVITGGINVYPEEIEERIRLWTKIRDVMVYGEPDPILGEILAAKVVCTLGEQVTLDELHHFLKDTTASYKWPKRLYVVNELHKTATGKTRREYAQKA